VLFCRASAIHSWRGWDPGGTARKTVRIYRPRQPNQHVHHRAGHLPRLLPVDLSHHQLALRRSAQGDTRERAARDLARLQQRTVQAGCLGALGDVRRSGGGDQGTCLPACILDRRRLADVRRSHSHDLGRRTGHSLRTGRGRLLRGYAGELLDDDRPMGVRRARRDLRRLRGAVSPRHYRRARPAPARQTLKVPKKPRLRCCAHLLSKHPVILGLFSGAGGRFVLYRPGMAPLDAPSVPIVYQLLKSVGHSTMALTEIVGPYLDNPDNQSWRGPMAAYRARMKAALDGLDATPMQADWRDNSRIILENNIAFMDDCLAKGSISLAALQAFAKKQAPYLKHNIHWAAQTQVGLWMNVIGEWKTMLGSDWDKTYAASNTIYVARQNNILFSV